MSQSTEKGSSFGMDPVDAFMGSFDKKWRWMDAFLVTSFLLKINFMLFLAHWFSVVSWDISMASRSIYFAFEIGLLFAWLGAFFMCAVGNRMGAPYWTDPRLFDRHQALLKLHLAEHAKKRATHNSVG